MNPLYPDVPESHRSPSLTVSMPDELFDAVSRAAGRMGITPNELVRICVRQATPRLLEAYDLVTADPSTLRRIAAAEFGQRRLEVHP